MPDCEWCGESQPDWKDLKKVELNYEQQKVVGLARVYACPKCQAELKAAQ